MRDRRAPELESTTESAETKASEASQAPVTRETSATVETPNRPARMDALQLATLPVPTASLKRKGIDTIRLLDESTFLRLVEEIVAARLKAATEALEKTVPEPAALESKGSGGQETQAAPNAAASDQESRAQWLILRARYLERVLRIEKVASRMSRAIVSFETALERLEAPWYDLPGGEYALPPAELRRLALLREMLHAELSRQ